MVTKELLEYIELESSKGFPFGAVKAALQKQGWKTEDIDEARTTIEGKLEKKTPLTSIASDTYTPQNKPTQPAINMAHDSSTPIESKPTQHSPFLREKPLVTAPPVVPIKTNTFTPASPTPQVKIHEEESVRAIGPIEVPKNIPTTWEKAPGSHPWLRFLAILLFGVIIAGISYLYNTGGLPWLSELLHR